jgi:TonB family protein
MKTISNLLIILFLCFAFAVSSNAQTSNNQQDRPLKIKSKPQISPSVFSRCLEGKRNTGIRALVKVTFHSSGKVTEVEIEESSGCEHFDKEALRIAKKLKFKPAIKDGEPITVVKTTEYGAYIH